MTTPKDKKEELIKSFYNIVADVDNRGKLTPVEINKIAESCVSKLSSEMIEQWDHFNYRDIARKDFWTLVRLSIK